jgi:tetratricopeptide (TPR) repeat protein
MAHLPKEYEFYDQVREKSEGLKDLVTNLLIIQEQDSLQRLGRMTETELDKYLSNIVQKEDEEEERRKREAENKESQLPTNLQAPGTGSSAWVFYNPTTLAQGNAEFKKIWGTRKLEDDWRRSDRTVLGDFTESSESGIVDSLEKAQRNKDKRVDKYKKTVPRTDKDLVASNEKLVKALYNAGAIYDDRLKEEKLAIECFERVVKDFPQSPNDLPAHYQLHVIYAPIDGAKSEMHKQYILEHYPDSDEAKILKNPNYKQEEAQREKGDEIKYAGVYELYRKRQYEDALLACNNVIEQEPANSMLSHYYYLRALTYGEMKQLDNFEKALSETALRYPKEEVGTAATDMLNYLRKKVSTDNAAAGRSTYIFEDNVEHFFVLVFKAGMGSVNDAKAKISNFDMATFSLAELKITNNFLNTDDQVILVKKFENEKKAMDYYIAFKQTDMVGDLNKKADYFVITNKNYASFYVEKKVEDYKKFFEENYLNLK